MIYHGGPLPSKARTLEKEQSLPAEDESGQRTLTLTYRKQDKAPIQVVFTSRIGMEILIVKQCSGKARLSMTASLGDPNSSNPTLIQAILGLVSFTSKIQYSKGMSQTPPPIYLPLPVCPFAPCFVW